MKRLAPRLAIWMPLLLVAALASADGTILHEYVPDLGADEGMLLVSSGGVQPEAIVYRGEVLPAPEGGGRRSGERALRPHPDPSAGEPSFRPDRVTSLNGTVGYYAVFTPTITPFKRVTAFDAVVLDEGTPVLVVGDSPRESLQVVGASAEASDGRARDRFWGSVVLDTTRGRVIPFPAVAAESRLLTVRTEPPTALTFERDGADNVYANLIGAGSPEVRVIFLMDAPRDYFGRELAEDPRVDALAARVRPLPPSVQRDAERFAAELGLSRRSRFADALRTLVGHFRSFEESDAPPADSGNIYLDLSRGMRGICRHRVYSFVITAHALGMHARFVQNEAHAWTEVEMPEGGWLRIDLGGAATGLDPRSDSERPMYDPRVPDSLPRPAAYQRAYEQARRMSEALAGSAAPSATSESPGRHPSGGSESGSHPAPEAGSSVTSREEMAAGASRSQPGEAARRPLELAVDRRGFEVFRGRELEVTGIARSDQGGVPGLRVEVLLRATRGESEWLLGVTVTRESGLFRAEVGVPPDLAVGDYELVVRTPGDAVHAPAQAR